MIIRKTRIVIMILMLTICIACTARSGEDSPVMETEIFNTTDASEELQHHSEDTKQNDNGEADDNHIPFISIDDVKNTLIEFWRKNQEDLEKTAVFMRNREITRISVYSDNAISVQFKDNTVTHELDGVNAARNVIEQCRTNDYLSGGEYKWVENGQLFVNESDYFIYKTRVFRDTDYDIHYTLYLVYSENTVSELSIGFATEELAPGWVLIIVELE